MPPLEYVHPLRLEEARQMLETGDLPIEAIANKVSHEDAAFLSRLFRHGNCTFGLWRLLTRVSCHDRR